jgi:hypothetical protein
MNTITATRTNNQTHRFVAEQIAKAMGVEIVDRAKVGKSVEFYTEDFRVIRVY